MLGQCCAAQRSMKELCPQGLSRTWGIICIHSPTPHSRQGGISTASVCLQSLKANGKEEEQDCKAQVMCKSIAQQLSSVSLQIQAATLTNASSLTADFPSAQQTSTPQAQACSEWPLPAWAGGEIAAAATEMECQGSPQTPSTELETTLMFLPICVSVLSPHFPHTTQGHLETTYISSGEEKIEYP